MDSGPGLLRDTLLACADGLSKKKKRKLAASIGGIYSGVSVSQLLAQRERAIAAVAPGVQGSPVPNGSQVIQS